MHFVIDDLKLLVGTIRLKISHLGPFQGPHQALFLIWGTFALTRKSFKLLTLRNLIIGTSLNTLLCWLSGAKRMCILVIMTFNWAWEWWYVILRISLSSFSLFLWLLSSSALQNFLVFKICFRTNLSLYPLPFIQISRSLYHLSKNEFSEKKLFSLKA